MYDVTSFVLYQNMINVIVNIIVNSLYTENP